MFAFWRSPPCYQELQVSSPFERLDEDFEISDGVVIPVGNTRSTISS
jgi:hypothetical protein